MSQVAVHTPLDPTGLGKAVQATLAVDIALKAAHAVVSVLELTHLAKLDPSALIYDVASPYTPVADTLGLAQFVVLLVATVLTAKYIYRASRNAHAAAGPLSDSPGWAIGWYFIPFANLWMPCRAFKQAWLANETPGEWRTRPAPPILRVWWGIWLLSSFIPLPFIFLQMDGQPFFVPETVEDLIWTDVSGIINGLAGVALDLVFIQIVRRLTPIQVKAMRWGVFD